METEIEKVNRLNDIFLTINRKKRERKSKPQQQNGDDDIEMLDDENDSEKKFWFEIKLNEMESLNPLKINICLSPQQILIHRIKGEKIILLLVKKLQDEIYNNNNYHYPLCLENYVASFLNPSIWHLEKHLRVTAEISTYAALSVYDMKMILKTLPNPGLWYHSHNVANADDFVKVVNYELSPRFREMIDLCPYLRKDTKKQEMKEDKVYRLNVKTPIKYVKNFQDCNKSL